MSDTSTRAVWGSRVGFIFAAAGSAVGLGAIWKFPYVAGQNGGGAFLLVFFACIFTLGLSLLLAEMLLGRMTRRSATSAYRQLGGGLWPVAGWASVFGLYLILSFYSVVGGWTMAYVGASVTGDVLPKTDTDAATLFTMISENPWVAVAMTQLFLLINMIVVMTGVEKGIERLSKILMPMLFILMLILIARVLTLPGAIDGAMYFLTPDFSKLSGDSLVQALGLAFFSLSLGCGMMVAYGSYVEKGQSLAGSTLWIAALASIACVMAGLMVLPAVFAFGLDPEAGPGLTFLTMPEIFAQLPFGQGFALAFFLLLFFAALTSSISIMEGVVSYFIDDWGWSRTKSSIVVALLTVVSSVPCALSFGVMSDPVIGNKTFFDVMDYFASNIIMPFGGIMVAVFVGWIIWPKVKDALAQEGASAWLPVLRFICAIVAPILISVIWIKGL